MRPIDADELLEHVYRDRLDSRERIANLVKSMPSVQPEKQLVAAIHFNRDDLEKIVVEQVEEIKKALPEWVPCAERLPEEPFACFVTVWDSTQTGEGDDFENVLPYFVGWDGEQWNDEDGVVAIVVRITNYLASLIVANGDEYGYIQYARNKTRLTKTGRHVDLSELFGGEEE